MTSDEYTLTSHCYIIEPPDEADSSKLAYFPLKSLVLRVNESAAGILEQLKQGPMPGDGDSSRAFLDNLVQAGVVNGEPDRLPDPPRYDSPRPVRTLLLASNRCNLACLYCFKAAETVGELMSWEVAKGTVDFLVENAVKHKNGMMEVGFHGGGEPTTNWDVLTRVTDYARAEAKKHNLRFKNSLLTNGIVSEKQARWIAGNIDNLMFSIDGPPEIQNKQRPMANGAPSFDHIASTVDIMRDLKKPFSFRVTATEHSAGSFHEVYTFLAERFSPSSIMVEPLFVCGRAVTTECQPPEAEVFIQDMLRTLSLTKKYKTRLSYSGGRLYMLDTRFCGAAGTNFFVTATGDVTSCLEVSDREDPRSDVFMYGRFNEDAGKFDLDDEKYRRLTGLRVQEFTQCNDCFAQFHCSGDCIAKAPDMTNITGARNEYRCLINKSLTRQQLVNEMHRLEHMQKTRQT